MKSPVQMSLFPEFEISDKKNSIVNVASVPQRSPFRYAGGKTWLIPVIRKWLRNNQNILLEPFLGGGSVSLSAVMERLTPYAIMTELDDEVSAVWETILSEDYNWLMESIKNFVVTRDNVLSVINKKDKDRKETAFSTIIKNRVFHGGILASGSGMMKKGEAGRGLSSRWYPATLCKRIMAIHQFGDKFEFHKADAFFYLEKYKHQQDISFFIDPPYTVAGRRLYNLHEIDHERLFKLVSEIQGHYMMTYDNCEMVKCLAEKYKLPYITVPMTTTHLIKKEEIIICDQLSSLD